MARWIVCVFVILMSCGAYAQDAAPATQPAAAPDTVVADSTTPKGTLTLLSRATNTGQTAAVRDLLHVSSPGEQRLADVLMERTEVYALFRQAAVKAFGEAAANDLTGNTTEAAADSERRIAAATVTINDDKATVQMEGQDDPVQLVKVDGKWKLSVAAITAGMGAGDINEKLDQIKMLSTVVRETSDEIGQGKYKGAEEVNDAIKGKLAIVMLRSQQGPTTEPATQPAAP